MTQLLRKGRDGIKEAARGRDRGREGGREGGRERGEEDCDPYNLDCKKPY